MPIVLNGEKVFAKKHPEREPREASEKHGREGWYKGEPVIFYEGVGWVDKTELAENAKKPWPSDTVFAGRHSCVPITDPPKKDTHGWKRLGNQRGKTRVIFQDGNWEIIPPRDSSHC